MLGLFSPEVEASWRVGAGLGFGGTGIEKVQPVDGLVTDVAKSEGPLVGHVYVDRLIRDRWGIGVEHSRGFRLGPFSSGVGFTSVLGRYYFLESAPELVADASSTTIVLKRLSPFVAVASGLASGRIEREGDRVGSVVDSGVHFGGRIGVDYLYHRSIGLRLEAGGSMTLMSTPPYPATLSMFSLGAGFFVSL